MTRWIVQAGAAHGPDPDRGAWDLEGEGWDWHEVDAPDEGTAVTIARLVDDDGMAGLVAAYVRAGRELDAVRRLPHTTRRDVETVAARRAGLRNRIGEVVAQAGYAARRARPWTLDETLERRRRWYELVRAGLSAPEIERHLGYSAESLAAAVRRHELA